jgi:putative intracellular protease/amidase
VSLVALPDAVVSTLFGIYDVMNAFALMRVSDADSGTQAPFDIDIVGEAVGPLDLASGVPINVQRAIGTIDTSDIVIVPSVLLRPQGWEKGRYPRLVEWLRRMHERGAVLCSACSGIFLLAETGLFDGRDATVHFGYARQFAAARRSNSSGASAHHLGRAGRTGEFGHDTVLHLIARFAGATAAQALLKVRSASFDCLSISSMFPAPVQTHYRPHSRSLPQAVPHPRFCPPTTSVWARRTNEHPQSRPRYGMKSNHAAIHPPLPPWSPTGCPGPYGHGSGACLHRPVRLALRTRPARPVSHHRRT